ncbi:head-tail adaptor protein [Chelatococcus sp. GCM10030263]|uniref:head-tail adaptor protein n=1 Tax=Chelatococcus sp. GCM10030263 TaxID=3273387 RepID=UPI003623FF43
MATIGQMRRALRLEVAVDTPDDVGGITRSWADLGPVWAALERPGDGSAERDHADRRELATSYRVTMRWRGDITGNHRLREGERVFAIRSAADPDGRRRRLVCTVEEVTP